jgi:hypothetical protein
LELFSSIVKEASNKIKDEGISNYPIFVAHQDEANIGIPLINKSDNGGIWSINASTLEEFYTKKLIKQDKLEDFKNLYRNHKYDICYFVLSEIGAQYLFIPV